MLANDEWKYDEIPEIMDGKNIADFVDPDILQRLEALEREEEMLEKKKASMMEESEEELDEDMLEAYDDIRNKKALKKICPPQPKQHNSLYKEFGRFYAIDFN